MLGYLAIPVWLVSLLCLIANSGALRIPLALAIIGFMSVGIYTERRSKKGRPAALEGAPIRKYVIACRRCLLVSVYTGRRSKKELKNSRQLQKDTY